MGTHVLFLHAVLAFQRRLVTSYKKQLNWDEERAESPDDRNRKPLFTLLALAIAIVTAGVSAYLFSSAPSGFDGLMPIILGLAIAYLGAPVALVLCFIALVREKGYLWVNLISIVICLANLLWLYVQSN